MAHTVVMGGGEAGPERFGLWLPLASGPVPWLDGAPLGAAERLAVAAGAASAMAAAFVVVATAAASPLIDGPGETAAFACGFVALVAAAILAPLRIRRPLPLIASRLLAGLGLLAVAVRVYESVPAAVIAAFGIAGGVEVAATLRVLGVDLPPGVLVRRACTSTLHLGVVTGLITVAVVAGSGEGRSAVAQLTVAFYVLAATAVGTFAAFRTLLARLDQEEDGRLSSARDDAHRDQAHWLHDEVCSELRYVRLHVETDVLDRQALLARLDELDHRLRLRQLDEVLQTRSALLGEIIQPYIRTAQANGVQILEVPSFETAGVAIATAAGRLAQRVLAVLTANAIQAGTRTLRLRTLMEGDVLVIEVEDDAGGFRPDPTAAWRGLDGLHRDLGPGALTLTSTGAGTLARAVVVLDDTRTAATR